MDNFLYKNLLELKKNEKTLDDLVNKSDQPVVVLDAD